MTEGEGRAADRNLDPQRYTAARQQSGMLFVVCASFLGLLGGIGFLFTYWTGGDNVLLGITLAVFFGGLGSALVLHSHWLMARKEATELREELPSGTSEREAFAETFQESEQEVQRRSLLKWIAVPAAGIIAAISISLFRSLGKPPDPSLFTNVWKRGQRLMTLDGRPVNITALEPGSTTVVFPEDSIGDEKAQTVVVRVNEQFLQLPKERANWAPMGYVAYSRVCTHAGCNVGLFEKTTNLLMCPCHQSTFDVLRAAQPTSGPAARPLPQLPLYADADGSSANCPALAFGGCHETGSPFRPMAGQPLASGEIRQEGDEPRISRSLVFYARGGCALFVHHTRDHRDIPRNVLQLELRAGDLPGFLPCVGRREDVGCL